VELFSSESLPKKLEGFESLQNSNRLLYCSDGSTKMNDISTTHKFEKEIIPSEKLLTQGRSVNSFEKRFF
jgi:hypothetical protein